MRYYGACGVCDEVGVSERHALEERDFEGNIIYEGDRCRVHDGVYIPEDKTVEYVKASYELIDIIEEWADMWLGPVREVHR